MVDCPHSVSFRQCRRLHFPAWHPTIATTRDSSFAVRELPAIPAVFWSAVPTVPMPSGVEHFRAPASRDLLAGGEGVVGGEPGGVAKSGLDLFVGEIGDDLLAHPASLAGAAVGRPELRRRVQTPSRLDGKYQAQKSAMRASFRSVTRGKTLPAGKDRSGTGWVPVDQARSGCG